MRLTNEEKLQLVERYQTGNSIASLCSETGIPRSTLYAWVKRYSPSVKQTNDNTGSIELRQQKKHIEKLEAIITVLKTVSCTAQAPLQERLRALEQLYGQFSVHVLCEALDVSRGTFYNHVMRNKKNNTSYESRRKELSEKIRQIYDDSHQLFGVGKVLAVLRDQGYATSQKLVSQLMHEMGLYSISPASKREYIKWQKGENRNIIQQQFHASHPNMIWVSDVTAYRFRQEYFYICAILDLFSRRVIAYRVAKTSSTQLITLTFRQAYSERSPEPGLVFHSDRGKQYLSKAFQLLLNECGIEQSLSRPGNPHDNAVMESFFSYLKREELYRHDYQSEAALLRSIKQYVQFYNSKRPHSTLQYKTPDRMEENARAARE